MASASAAVPAVQSCSQEDSCTQSIPDADTSADVLADSNTIAGTISAAHTTAEYPADAISKANHTAGAGTTAVEEAIAEARADMEPIADINNIARTDTETNAFTDAITDTVTDPDTSAEALIPLQSVTPMLGPCVAQIPLAIPVLMLFQLARELHVHMYKPLQFCVQRHRALAGQIQFQVQLQERYRSQ